MKHHLHISIILLICMTVVNLVGGMINQSLNYSGNFFDAFGTIPILICACLIYFFTSIPKLNISTTFRLPILRIIFWSIIIIIGIMQDNRMGTEDALIHLNSGVCLLYNTLLIPLNKIGMNINQFVELFILHILLIGLYEALMIKISKMIYKE